ncbi:MAG: methionyl-tRNA formyltransferase [Candidatus Magasanikbacteria bacterium CG10_big_fil_rev_8_21_14_0_10_47_10]|uniref:Methionyl-tRNA formyltransferase n=1 Tax=Candidatus Magasanikbacteria bacterium CG10_big_fil_rev_8_21_14_0_10_47_10 TaxID=1974652 RepID=A0A2H0TPC9_9BACT|nr:MAG: methionyl-tRNA formyltransferase [Candidatus Magasanikbacteria bacterium CG10_big_fil_rev_8_21_14_0_10_47_10]
MDAPIRMIFYGTQQFAVTVLQVLLKSPMIEVGLVVTQPDKPTGRKKEVVFSPIKTVALQHDIPIVQPDSLKSWVPEMQDVDLAVVAQYGNIIPERLLSLPVYGTLNVHTSLLPKYRGASPIQTAILHGETKTGVTIMKMDKGLDTGPILIQEEITIDPDETYPQLDARLAVVGANLLARTIPPYISGSLVLAEQDNSAATTCTQLTRDDGLVDWQKSAQHIYNQYRAMTPWPGIWTTWNGRRLKLLRVKPADLGSSRPGRASAHDNAFFVETADGALEIVELQMEGKTVMTASQFLSGNHRIVGADLGI